MQDLACRFGLKFPPRRIHPATGITSFAQDLSFCARKQKQVQSGNSLPTIVHTSVVHFLTSSDNKVLHDEVVKELEAPPCNLIWTGLGNHCHGANVQDPYLYTFIRSFHFKMAFLLGLTPLLLLDRPHNFLVKPIFFSPLLQRLWTHLAVLAVPVGRRHLP